VQLYRLDASIRIEGSHSRAIADLVEGEWHAGHPGGTVTRRDVGIDPIPATAWPAAVGARRQPDRPRSAEEDAALSLSAQLADELVGADAYLFAVPLYNFGVSQHFKAFVDLAITDPRMAPGGEPPLRGRPAVLVAVRGGSYAPGTPREGWDHATGWMRRILADVWGLELRTVESEFTLVGENPALDQFRGVAEVMWADARTAAVEEGRSLARLVAA